MYGGNFALDNNSLYNEYINPDRCPIAAHNELKLEILIGTTFAENLGTVRQKSVTVKYAGQAIANVKW